MVFKRQRWTTDFMEWFSENIAEAEIYDYRYPVKGSAVWRPYGFALRGYVSGVLRSVLDQTGHEEILLPILVPEEFFRKESQHVAGFEAEVYWITHGGLTPLDVKLALRPTSEVVITPMLKLWVSSHAQLPKKFYQVANVFRYETKTTRPMIRIRDVTTFKEAHTAHATSEEAEKQVRESIEIYKRIFDDLCIPYLISRRPDWDRFPGAVYSVAFECVMPDSRVLQIGTTHFLGQNFSKAFDADFETATGERTHLWQTSYGISERAIAALLAVHGDDQGLVLPPQVAPTQVVVIPIPYKGKEAAVNDVCQALTEKLRENRIRAHLDDRPDKTPGNKFYDWEIRGVPLRIEIGPRDVEDKMSTLARRDTGERSTCRAEETVSHVKTLLDRITNQLRESAWNWQKEHVKSATTLKEAKGWIANRRGVAEAPWCGQESCGRKMEESADARTIGIPVEEGVKATGDCLICGQPAKDVLRLAKAY